MKISVVIPAHNEEKRIGKCLESLMNQKEKPDEIIVVNNNSTDKTAKIAKSYGAIVINEKKQGISFVRNAGFNLAKGDVIVRIDADTTAPTDWIKRIKKDLKSDKIGAVFGPASYSDLPLLNKTSTLITTYFFNVFKIYLKKHLLFGLNMAIKKTLWEKAKNDLCMDDTKVHDDFDLAIHLWKYGEIKFDKDLRVKTSPRKWKSIYSDVEYTQRLIKMLKSHNLILPKILVKNKYLKTKTMRRISKTFNIK
nr:glycosyltransferase family 2 protein [Candidatus Levybacteria bacterium]